MARLLYVNRRGKNQKALENRKVSTKPYISRTPTLGAYNTLQTERPIDLDNFDKLKNCLVVFTSFRHFVKCHENHVNRARVLIGWQLPTRVCQSFTRQIRAYQHEQVGEKVGENRSKFYLSPTVCQRVCRLFLFRSHTPTSVCQREFANLVCFGCLSMAVRVIVVVRKISLREGSTPRSNPFLLMYIILTGKVPFRIPLIGKMYPSHIYHNWPVSWIKIVTKGSLLVIFM